MSNNCERCITEHIFELRYDAIGKFLDMKGVIADYIKNHTDFKHWSIQGNVIFFSDEPDAIKNPKAIIAYNKIAFVAPNPGTKNFFQEEAIAFLKEIIDVDGFMIPQLNRLGIRTKCFIPSDNLSFDEIHRNIHKKLFNNSLAVIGKNPTDLQLILDMHEATYKTRLVLGPVHEDEVSNYFSFAAKKFLQPGLYIDVDFFKTEGIHYELEKIKHLIEKALELTWAKIEAVANTIEI